MNALIIENNPVFQKVLSETLGKSDFADAEIMQGMSLAEGIAILEQAEVDVVLLDLNLPDSDGLDTFSEVFARAPDVPIIVVSAMEDVETSMNALKMGAQDYLVKSKFDADMLIRSIRYSIERKKVQIDINRTNQDLSMALKEVRQKEQQLVQQERLRALGQMASGVAHDFNNALQPIMLAANLIEEDDSIFEQPEVLKDYIEEILNAARVAAETVSRLTQFYRPETNREKAVVDLSALVRNATELTRPKWKQEAHNQGITVELGTNLAEDCYVYGLYDELREMLINLVFNAVDAIKDEGRITVETRIEGEWAQLEIRDTGCGMSEEVRQKCFEPFYTTKEQRGSGLGLAIIYGIIQRHDGEIAIESEESRGTVVRVDIPRIEKGEEEEIGLIEMEHVERSGAERGSYRILIVEDEPPVLRLLKNLLERVGHSVVAATSGQQAWEHFIANSFDAVITDRAMPGMTGEQLASLIKEKTPDLPVIMLSGFGELMKERGESFEAVDMIMGKPASLQELQKVLKRLVNK